MSDKRCAEILKDRTLHPGGENKQLGVQRCPGKWRCMQVYTDYAGVRRGMQARERVCRGLLRHVADKG